MNKWNMFGLVCIMIILGSTTAAALPYVAGDVFAGTGNGNIKVYSSAGVFKQTLDTTSNSNEQTGMCFDGSGNLYATSWTTSTMTKFDSNGLIVTHPWGSSFSNPESCVFNNAGEIYVGNAGSNLLKKFSSTGALLNTYTLATEFRGIDWIDLAADQKTIYYTSEGTTVKRFDVNTNSQVLPDFATGLSRPCYALRIRANGEVMVACSSQVYRLSSTGSIMQTYLTSSLIKPEGGTETSFLFALNLDPDGQSFWTGGYSSGNIYKIDIATGTQLLTFNAPPVYSMAGLAIFGEPVVGGPGGPGIPEFPTVALPIASVLGIMFLMSRRKHN